MSVNQIKNTIFNGTLLGFFITVILSYAFAAEGVVTAPFVWALGIAGLLASAVLMCYIFLYGDGEELNFYSLIYAIPGIYLLYSVYHVFGALSSLQIIVLYSLESSNLYFDMCKLFTVWGLWNLTMPIFASKSHWLPRVLRGIAGLCPFLPYVITIIIFSTGGTFNYENETLINTICYGVSALFFAAYAFFQIRDCED
ncbi:MAG: hypothetical protein IKD28_02980 [Clostridia bacterium]|nr:hypothetical protein [Clostridia bacterium]